MEELNTIENELKEKQLELDSILSPEDIYHKELAKLERQYSAKVEKIKKEIATIEALKEKDVDKTTQDEKDLIEANNEEIEKKIKRKSNSLNRITANYEKKKAQLEIDKIKEETNYKAEKQNKEKEIKAEKQNKEKEIKAVKTKLLKAIENSRKEVEEKEQEAIAKMEKAKQDFSEKVKKQKKLEQDLAIIKKVKQDFKGISTYTNVRAIKLQVDETSKETMRQLKELAKARTQIWENKIKFEKEAKEAKENKETVIAKINYLMEKYSLQEIEQEEAVFEEEQEEAVFEEEQEAFFEEEQKEAIFEEEQEEAVFEEEQEAFFEEEQEAFFEEEQEAFFEEEQEEAIFEEEPKEANHIKPSDILLQIDKELQKAGLENSQLKTELSLREIVQMNLFYRAINNPKIPPEQLKQTKQEMKNYYRNWNLLEAAKKILNIQQQAGDVEDYHKIQKEIEQLIRYKTMPRQTPMPSQEAAPATVQISIQPVPAPNPEPIPNPEPTPPPSQQGELKLTEIICFTKAGYYHFTFSDGTTIGINQSTRLNERAESIIKAEVESKIAKTDNLVNQPDYMLIEAMSDAFLSKERKSSHVEKAKIRENTEKTIKQYLDAIRTGKQEDDIPMILYDGITGIEAIREELKQTLNYNEALNRETDLCELTGLEKHKMSSIIKRAGQIEGFATATEKHSNKLLEMLKKLKLETTNIINKVKLLDKEENLEETQGEEVNNGEPIYATSKNENSFFSGIEATDEQKKLAVEKGQEAAKKVADQTPIAEFTKISEEATKGQEY